MMNEVKNHALEIEAQFLLQTIFLDIKFVW